MLLPISLPHFPDHSFSLSSNPGKLEGERRRFQEASLRDICFFQGLLPYDRGENSSIINCRKHVNLHCHYCTHHCVALVSTYSVESPDQQGISINKSGRKRIHRECGILRLVHGQASLMSFKEDDLKGREGTWWRRPRYTLDC